MTSTEKIVQRYTLALLDLALHSKFTMALPSIDECEWLGVTCTSTPATTTTPAGNEKDDGAATVVYEPVTAIVWNDHNMTGTQIPNDIVLLSNSLVQLDLSNNTNLAGTIPYGLYSCTQLQYWYMYNTQITGSIRTEIGQLSNLKKFFLDTSAITGTIPTELGIASLGTIHCFFRCSVVLSHDLNLMFSFSIHTGRMVEFVQESIDGQSSQWFRLDEYGIFGCGAESIDRYDTGRLGRCH